MLYLIGAGIYETFELSNSIDILKNCDRIYIEMFTSPISDNVIQNLKSTLEPAKKIEFVKRWFVEDGRQILDESKTLNVALVSYGDPTIATTFTELRTRAIRSDVNVRVIHAASGITSLVGESGLQIYKIGKLVTMMEERQSGMSVYTTIFNNLNLNCHTIILTEYRQQENGSFFFLKPNDVISRLIEMEKDFKYGFISDDSFLIVLSRIGTDNQRIVSGKANSLLGIDYGDGPHALIFPSKLHFIEEEAILNLTESIDTPSDNTATIRTISDNMIIKYEPMIRKEILQIRDSLVSRKYHNKIQLELLENAELYLDDAIQFFRQGKKELAVLSIGYADGLVDSIKQMLEIE